jgi:phenylacetic acid degradation protein
MNKLRYLKALVFVRGKNYWKIYDLVDELAILSQNIFTRHLSTIMIYEFKGIKPVIHHTAFIHPLSAITGNVIIGKDVYIGPGAALRGDWGQIIIEDGCNVQENCTIHMFPGVTVFLREAAHIGHGAIIHGATIGRNCLIGMNAVVMDNVELGDECVVGALSFIKQGEKIPPRSLLAGNPAKLIKQVTDEMITWKTEGTKLYQQLPAEMREHWKECEPLREVPEGRTAGGSGYMPWRRDA